MLIRSFFLILLLEIITLSAAEPSSHLDLYLDPAMLEALITPDSTPTQKPPSPEQPLSVDPNFPWDNIFHENHYPCLESNGCKESFQTLKNLTDHLKKDHEPCYTPPMHCAALDRGIQKKFPHVATMPIIYRTMWTLHYFAHQRSSKEPQELITCNQKFPSPEMLSPRVQWQTQRAVAAPAKTIDSRKRKYSNPQDNRDIHWEPILVIHEAKCKAKLQAKLPNHEGEEPTGDPDDL